MQVDPIKPLLKAPGTKRLEMIYDGPLSYFACPIKPALKAPRAERFKLMHDGPLSNFAFNFILRRYTKGGQRRLLLIAAPVIDPVLNNARRTPPPPDGFAAGSYTRPLHSSTCAVSDTITHPKHPLNTP